MDGYKLDSDGYVLDAGRQELYHGMPTVEDDSGRYSSAALLSVPENMKEHKELLARARLTKKTMYDFDEVPLGFAY